MATVRTRKKKTVHISKLSIAKMVTGGEKTITKVIHNGMLKNWVGIGWVTERVATVADERCYPKVVEGKSND